MHVCHAGVGKTVQAIALAACHMHEWSPLLVICPASLRLLWCEELEKWLPGIRPCDITVVQGSADWHPEAMGTTLSAADTHKQQSCKVACTADAVHASQQVPCAKQTDTAEKATSCIQANLQDGVISGLESDRQPLQQSHSTLQEEAEAVPTSSATDEQPSDHTQLPSSARCEQVDALIDHTDSREAAAPPDVEATIPKQTEGTIDVVKEPTDASMHMSEDEIDPEDVLNSTFAAIAAKAEALRAQGTAIVDTHACSTSAAAASPSQQQSEPQSEVHPASQKADFQAADGSQQPASQHEDVGGEEDKPTGKKSQKIIIISYHMAANLSCAACKFPSTSNSNNTGRPSPAKGSKGKGATKCTGFPHCVAAGVFPFVIVDESHHMRTQSGPTDNQLTEVAKQIVHKSRRAVLLSGTPSVTRPFDLAGQLYCLQPDLMATAGGFAKFKTSLAFRYCQRRLIKTRRYASSACNCSLLQHDSFL